jgi:DNA-binding MarR family transcriptional regulator
MAKRASPLKLEKSNYEALAGFRFALRSFLAFSERAAAEAGVSPQQYQAMLAIKGASGREALTILELSEQLLIRHHTAGELVTRLAKQGLVTRLDDPNDGRRVLVKLTAKAEKALQGLALAHFEELQGIRPALLSVLAQFDSGDG